VNTVAEEAVITIMPEENKRKRRNTERDFFFAF
jgi:hypothetical protein